MSRYFGRMARMPTWIAGLAISLLAVLALSASVRSIPVSYADVAEKRVPSTLLASDGPRVIDSKDNVVLVHDSTHRRSATSCRECGVVTSIREQVSNTGAGPGDAKLAARTSAGGASGAIAMSAFAEKTYEMTVRFRDGSTTVLDQPAPGNWRPGMRVIVVARPKRSTDQQ